MNYEEYKELREEFPAEEDETVESYLNKAMERGLI